MWIVTPFHATLFSCRVGRSSGSSPALSPVCMTTSGLWTKRSFFSSGRFEAGALLDSVLSPSLWHSPEANALWFLMQGMENLNGKGLIGQSGWLGQGLCPDWASRLVCWQCGEGPAAPAG